MQDMWIRLLAILSIFAMGLSSGMFPRRVSVSPQGRRWLLLGNALAGGIFISAGLLHMLPDAQENLEAFVGNSDYPYAYLLCGIGFLLVLFLEKVLLRGQDEDALAESTQSYPIVLMLVLSVHSIIAGATLGLETAITSSIAIYIAIIAHKGFAAFALGVSLAEAQVPKNRHFGTIATFSLMTPLGILLGTLFATLFASETARVAEGLFDGLAAGTFLYVGILEIVEEVFEVQLDHWQKFVLISAGFGFMALLAAWA